MPLFLVLLAMLLSVSGCRLLRESPKYQFSNGFYTSPVFGKNSANVYIVNDDNEIRAYAAEKTNDGINIDTTHYLTFIPDKQYMGKIAGKLLFQKTSLDVDFLTIPFKYRPTIKNFPRQFTAQLNGGMYVGYRGDRFTLHYDKNPLGVTTRRVNHFGFSLGGFTGIGSTAMNPWVTLDQINIEYEGVAAAIAGINQFSAGVALGWDHLIDQNNKIWIYQVKPWIGFVFGLSLN